MSTPTPGNVERLEPCPFCGGEAQAYEHSPEDTWSVRCTSCAAAMNYVGLTEAEAVTGWNTRPDGPEAAALLKQFADAARLFVIDYDAADQEDGVALMLAYNRALNATKAVLSTYHGDRT